MTLPSASADRWTPLTRLRPALAPLARSPIPLPARVERESLLLRLGRKRQRKAGGLAGIGGAGGLGLGDIAGEDGNDATALPVRGDHDAVGLVFGDAELGLEHANHKLARRVIIIEQDHLVELRLFDLGFGRSARLGDGGVVAHPRAPGIGPT